MNDKLMSEDDVVARLQDGMVVGIGGWGSRRKPMSVVRAILRSDLTDLTVVSYGGPDVGMLCAAGKVRKVVYAFVSLDVVALEPNFRRAREAGTVSAVEMDEGMMLLGLQAAAWRVPFLPTRVGLGTDLLRLNDDLTTVTSPYPAPDGTHEELVAVPALPLDAAIVHVNRADSRGNSQALGVDPFFDQLMVDAAAQSYVSCDELVSSSALLDAGDHRTLLISRHKVAGVVVAPHGAHPTSCEPAYGADEAFLRDYAASASTDDAWEDFRCAWLATDDETEYQAKVSAR